MNPISSWYMKKIVLLFSFLLPVLLLSQTTENQDSVEILPFEISNLTMAVDEREKAITEVWKKLDGLEWIETQNPM